MAKKTSITAFITLPAKPKKPSDQGICNTAFQAVALTSASFYDIGHKKGNKNGRTNVTDPIGDYRPYWRPSRRIPPISQNDVDPAVKETFKKDTEKPSN